MAPDQGQLSLWREYNALVARNEGAERKLKEANRAAEALVRAQLTEAFGETPEPEVATAIVSTPPFTPRDVPKVQAPPAGLEAPSTPRHVTSTAGPPPATPPVTPYHISRVGHGFSNALSERASTVAPDETDVLDMDVDADLQNRERVEVAPQNLANPGVNLSTSPADVVKPEELSPITVQGGEVVDLCGAYTSDEAEDEEMVVVEEPKTPTKPPPSLARHFGSFKGDPVSPTSPTSTAEKTGRSQAQNEQNVAPPTQSQTHTARPVQKAARGATSIITSPKPAATASAAGSLSTTNPSTPKPALKRPASMLIVLSDDDSDYAPQDSPPPPPKRQRPASSAKKSVTIASPPVTPTSSSRKSGPTNAKSVLSKKPGPSVVKPAVSHARMASHPQLHHPLSPATNMRMRLALMAPPPSLGVRAPRAAATKAREMTGMVVREEARLREMSDDALMVEIENGRLARLSLEPPERRQRPGAKP
ncbi:hypothetical protein BU16DRAFT_89899 [Lophium mytilinum]|uniref:Uncharacterized protein n=1 Tax=Lophium mytilinum TaxID=390894 RepID=A0A6A6QL38_9PEZI|nr:hypothetical protein BU16DRAFT_89899 [Lophium mytilinum]